MQGDGEQPGLGGGGGDAGQGADLGVGDPPGGERGGDRGQGAQGVGDAQMVAGGAQAQPDAPVGQCAQERRPGPAQPSRESNSARSCRKRQVPAARCPASSTSSDSTFGVLIDVNMRSMVAATPDSSRCSQHRDGSAEPSRAAGGAAVPAPGVVLSGARAAVTVPPARAVTPHPAVQPERRHRLLRSRSASSVRAIRAGGRLGPFRLVGSDPSHRSSGEPPRCGSPVRRAG